MTSTKNLQQRIQYNNIYFILESLLQRRARLFLYAAIADVAVFKKQSRIRGRRGSADGRSRNTYKLQVAWAKVGKRSAQYIILLRSSFENDIDVIQYFGLGGPSPFCPARVRAVTSVRSTNLRYGFIDWYPHVKALPRTSAMDLVASFTHDIT